jgi:HPt (histidine-containing phosphotransfer) domain-containing protein
VIWSIVNAMKSVPKPGDKHLTADGLAGVFTEVLADLLPELETAVQAADWERVRFVAHRLEGSASMFGFFQISGAGASFQAVWSLAKTPNPIKTRADLVESAEELVRACERVARAGSEARAD